MVLEFHYCTGAKDLDFHAWRIARANRVTLFSSLKVNNLAWWLVHIAALCCCRRVAHTKYSVYAPEVKR